MNETKVNIGNGQKEKIITKELKISKNIFIYNESAICLNNISRISIENAPKEPYSRFIILTIIISLFLLSIEKVFFVLVGILGLLFSLFQLYTTYKKNQDLGEYLVLNLNSGRDIYLYSKNHVFTIEVIDVIINCINSEKEYKINMENCQIEACQFGNSSMMLGR